VIPLRWHLSKWDDKARQNPLFAIMSSTTMQGIGTDSPTEGQLSQFFAKGRSLADTIVMPGLSIAPQDGAVVEYGCGAGRILNALAERGIGPLIGVDISPTMLELCRRYVPKVEQLVAVGSGGHIALPDGCARLVYSYAVLQHIDRLSVFEHAIDEMCRLAGPAGALALQTSCKDLANPECTPRGRTWNFERLSIYPKGPFYMIRPNTSWYGVVIGYDRLAKRLQRNGFEIVGLSHPKPSALWSAIVLARRVP
jgi:SAM-dependent methyltransferase